MERVSFWIIVIAVLFILVILNNKRNIKKKRNLKTRSFKKSYYDKKSKENETDLI